MQERRTVCPVDMPGRHRALAAPSGRDHPQNASRSWCPARSPLAACAAPVNRISSGLRRYGLDTQRSDCVGTRLQSDLTPGQLQQSGRAAAYWRALTAGDLLRVATEMTDPVIALTLRKAAAGCNVVP